MDWNRTHSIHKMEFKRHQVQDAEHYFHYSLTPCQGIISIMAFPLGAIFFELPHSKRHNWPSVQMRKEEPRA